MADLDRLHNALQAEPLPLFGVVDAAHFDNLPAILTEAGVPSRPLYLSEDEDRTDTRLLGPHLVDLGAGPDSA